MVSVCNNSGVLLLCETEGTETDRSLQWRDTGEEQERGEIWAQGTSPQEFSLTAVANYYHYHQPGPSVLHKWHAIFAMIKSAGDLLQMSAIGLWLYLNLYVLLDLLHCMKAAEPSIFGGRPWVEIDEDGVKFLMTFSWSSVGNSLHWHHRLYESKTKNVFIYMYVRNCGFPLLQRPVSAHALPKHQQIII